jgi:hypothetical protein
LFGDIQDENYEFLRLLVISVKAEFLYLPKSVKFLNLKLVFGLNLGREYRIEEDYQCFTKTKKELVK